MTDQVPAPTVPQAQADTGPAASPSTPSPASSASPIAVPSPASDAAAPVPTPAADAPKTEAAPAAEAPKAEISLLGDAPKVETPAAPVDAAKAPESGEAPKEEVSQSAEPAPLPTYEDFTLPEGVSLEKEKLADFTKELGEFQNLTKSEQAEVQKFGQKMVERHVTEVKNALERQAEIFTQQWEKQKSDWKEEFIKDPEFGGNRQETTVTAAREFIQTHGGSEDEQKAFYKLMNDTGLGNNPTIIRMLARANMKMAEGKPLPAVKPASDAKRSKIETRYGKA